MGGSGRRYIAPAITSSGARRPPARPRQGFDRASVRFVPPPAPREIVHRCRAVGRVRRGHDPQPPRWRSELSGWRLTVSAAVTDLPRTERPCGADDGSFVGTRLPRGSVPGQGGLDAGDAAEAGRGVRRAAPGCRASQRPRASYEVSPVATARSRTPSWSTATSPAHSRSTGDAAPHGRAAAPRGDPGCS